jgi:hypothetical protein
MPVCKQCGKKFHACGNCGLMTSWEWDYCSKKCWDNSEEVKSIRDLYNKIYEELSDRGKERFKELMEYACDMETYNILF